MKGGGGARGWNEGVRRGGEARGWGEGVAEDPGRPGPADTVPVAGLGVGPGGQVWGRGEGVRGLDRLNWAPARWQLRRQCTGSVLECFGGRLKCGHHSADEIQGGSAFGGRALRQSIRPRLLARPRLVGAFRQIQEYGEGRASKLVLQIAAVAWQGLREIAAASRNSMTSS